MRILLIEDNVGDVRLFEEMLRDTTIPGVTVECHRKLEDACRAVREDRFDAAFLDLGLPDAEGLPALQRLHEAAPKLPIVVLTGRAEEALSFAALRSGAQDYLLKDRLHPEYLGQTIRFAIQRKQVEEALKQRERETHQTQKLEAIGQLAAGIAHEINTPMQFIGDNLFFLKEAMGDLDALLRLVATIVDSGQDTVSASVVRELAKSADAADLGYLLDELPAAIERSTTGVERVTKIVRAMKEFSHPGSEEQRLVPLASAIESTLTVCRSEWKYVADVDVDIPADLPAIPCYPGDLNQVFLNIIVNAAHAIAAKLGDSPAEKGRISVAARQSDRDVEIRISDTGTGIPDSALPRIFEPFFTTKDVGKGTGQGLFLAYKVVVDKHGGRIDAETVAGEGTTLVLRLPLDPVQAAVPAVIAEEDRR